LIQRTGEIDELLDAPGSSLPRGERPTPITSSDESKAFNLS
jgi:hypothetical protein